VFGPEETSALKRIRLRPQPLEIFQYSKVTGLLKKLPKGNHPNIELWKNELISAMKNYNEKAFSEPKALT